MSYEKVENTFFEAFEGQYVRALITGPTKELVERAAYDSTSTPSAVIGRIEGGVEGFLAKSETPDGRYGAVVQYWLGGDNVEKFAFELSYRIRQDILVKPFMRVFDYPDEKSDEYIEMMDIVGHCGDGYEWTVEEYGRKLINVPIAVPDFQIEEKLSLNKGTMGGNFWYLCETQEAVLEGGKRALDAIQSVTGAIAPFDICSAASKPETNYPSMRPQQDTTTSTACQEFLRTFRLFSLCFLRVAAALPGVLHHKDNRKDQNENKENQERDLEYISAQKMHCRIHSVQHPKHHENKGKHNAAVRQYTLYHINLHSAADVSAQITM